ncbi:hypothetical protein QFC21_004682 [Naganishia friedmannii]|uniref:Uncharacterized protein n=1 Tax=Naganishia friedmannii TaxID=89922 RepID=A0ACC2VGB2_9TREE|nr:hypothetical protein QFC21_004682 [Naganishia friedmannii]
MDDIAAAAWGDDNSPGHSPTLNERDIWGAPERPALQERDEAAGRVGGDTMLHVDEEEQGVDVWAVPSEKEEDTVASPKTSTTNDTPMEEPSTTSPNINTAAAVSSLATESETSPKGEEAGATPLSVLTSADNTSTHFQTEEEDSFADFEDEPFPTLATVASSSSALPVPASTSEAFRNNNSNHEKEQADGFTNPSTAAPAAAAGADDFADFGDFEDFDDDDQDGGGVRPAAAFPSSEHQNPAVLSDGFGASETGVITSGFGGGGEFTEEPLDVWDDPDRPAPLVSPFHR